MISKRKMALSLAGVAAMFMVGATTFGAGPASASGAGVCQVTGAVTSSGIGLSPTSNTFGFTSVTITCTTSDASTTGDYIVNASGNTTLETCAAGTVNGNITSGRAPNGASLSGSFSGARVGANVYVGGNISFTGHNVSFQAHLIFTPTNGTCSPGGTGPTTTAAIAVGSPAVVAEQ